MFDSWIFSGLTGSIMETWLKYWWELVIGFVVAVLGVFGMAGCGIVNTGPAVAKAAVEGASGGLKTMLAQYQPGEMHADIGMDVNDPTYRATVFVGVGTLCEIVLSLQGAEARVDVRSSGKGVEIPLEVKTELLSIIGNHSISEEERSTMMVEAILGLLNRQPTPPPGTDEEGDEQAESPGESEGENVPDGTATEVDALNEGAFTYALDPDEEYRVVIRRGDHPAELLTFKDGRLLTGKLEGP